MRNIGLDARLLKIASLIKENERIADVGTDHGFLPVYLLQRGIIDFAILTDLREAPLERARRHAELYGLRDKMRFILCRGLDAVEADTVGTVIIAGMGGETIVDILSAAPWTKQKRLILQPMSAGELLRGFLCENGYEITDEFLVKDAGRLYFIIEATGGEMPPMNLEELYLGRILQNKNEPLLEEYIYRLIEITKKAAEGMKKSSKPCDISRLEEYEKLLEVIAGVKEKLK